LWYFLLMNTLSEEVLTGEKALDADSSFSHVVALPYTSRLVTEAGTIRTELSWPSEIALHAGIIALNQHNDAKLIVVGEDAHEGLDSTTDLTVERATTAYGVDRGSIWPVYRLGNGKLLNGTYRQIAGASQALVTVKSPNVLGVGFKDHLQRIMQASQGVNFSASFVSVEEVLRVADVHDYDHMLPLIAGIRRTERIKRIIGQKRGLLFNALLDVGRAGHIYLDVDETTGKLVEMSARKRRKQLESRLLATNSTITTK
jgi:hypothetical protein